MKNLLYLTFIVLLSLPETIEAKRTSKIQSESVDIFKRKKGFRRKKGFLWGLFRKRNQCDCPKH